MSLTYDKIEGYLNSVLNSFLEEHKQDGIEMLKGLTLTQIAIEILEKDDKGFKGQEARVIFAHDHKQNSYYIYCDYSSSDKTQFVILKWSLGGMQELARFDFQL